MKVKDIMSEKVVVATPNHKVSQAFEFFANFSISHLPVVDGDHVIGIISARDIIKIIYEELLNSKLEIKLTDLDKHFTIQDLMTQSPITVKVTDDVKFVSEIFNRNSFHAIPVEENGSIKGIVTTKDLAKAIANYKKEE